MLGPQLGGAVQKVMKAARAGDWTTNADGTVTVAGHTLAPGEFELALEPGERGPRPRCPATTPS